MASSHPYREVYSNPKDAGDARPTAQQIIDDEGLQGKWEDKTCLITGVSSFIGISTARALASTGARLFLTVRNMEKGKKALGDLLSDRVQLIQMDNTSLASLIGHIKTADIYMSNHIDRLYSLQGLHSTSLDPGGIATGLQVYIPQETRDFWNANETIQQGMKSQDQGASTTVYAAVSRDWEGKGGRYLQDYEEAPKMGEERTFIPGYAAYAYDEEKEKRLWEDSFKMAGL